MADEKLAQKRNTGAAPMAAQPNHDREKTYDAPKTPKPVQDEQQALPEQTARDKVRDELPEAVEKVKRQS